MPLSWNEIKDRALNFSKEWKHEYSEGAEAKTFWDSFFDIFGISRRRVASFETPVKKSDGKGGFIDLLWKGLLVVEHKSRGKDLDRAFHQALDYFPGLKDRDLPRYIIVSDFARFRLYDLETSTDEIHEFPLEELHKNVNLFGFIAGYQTRSFGQEDPVNIEAARRLGKIHDLLKAVGYKGHALEVFLVRLLFCLFAEDTGIFESRYFREYLEQRTSEDGADLGMTLGQLFQILNTSPEDRLKNLDEQLAAFRYINGRLFQETLPIASFDRKMRETLLDCCALNWSRISPAIFGSLFQSIMGDKVRREIGAHYTTEKNILKALKPLFLDSLREEFERVKRDAKRLAAFQNKLSDIRVFDPACGCGNFLVIAYRELRLLELDVLRELYKNRRERFLNVHEKFVYVDVDQFYGIELEEFPAQIAQVALWLTDHQMNLRVSEEFGQYFVRLPLQKAPNIFHGNALTLDWKRITAPNQISYIVSNPPYVGKQYQNGQQKLEISTIFRGVKGAGVLDYVSCWYRRAMEYLKENPQVQCAFVSTNSITQGEQVGVLWPGLFNSGIYINFAHRTFQWTSEAKGKAGVHCVIIGFSLRDEPTKWLFDYETPKSEPHAVQASSINAYLVDSAIPFLEKRRSPISSCLPMAFGSMPNDGGFLLLSALEKSELLADQPNAAPWLRRLFGSKEFLHNIERWCLWLNGISSAELRSMPAILRRVKGVKRHRQASRRKTTSSLSSTPTLFGEIRQPVVRYLAVPEVSSENRSYIPIGFLSSEAIATNKLYTIDGAGLYDFGVLTSKMHMAWTRAVCGRLESRYQYSAGIVYNNFPWPSPNEKHRKKIEALSQAVLNERDKFPDDTLADLYDPLAMPPTLIRAHQTLDRAVDSAYGRSFKSDAERVSFLFQLYSKVTASLTFTVPIKRRKGK